MIKKSYADFIDEVASKSGMTKTDVESCFEARDDVLVSNLVAGNEVQTKLGKFMVTDSAARVGRNPQTGAPIDIPAKRVPKFRAGKKLKDAVQG